MFLDRLNKKLKTTLKKCILLPTTAPIKIDIKFGYKYPAYCINSLFWERGQLRPRQREETNGEKTINADKTFKFNECAICLTNPPNVLFCNCGHQCICINCNKKKSLVKCPICKTENTIKRILN